MKLNLEDNIHLRSQWNFSLYGSVNRPVFEQKHLLFIQELLKDLGVTTWELDQSLNVRYSAECKVQIPITHYFLRYRKRIFITPCPAELDLSFFENSVDPDQMASNEAILSGSTPFSL